MITTLTEHIEIDREQRSICKNGQEIHLTGLEYSLLEFLSAHPNRICTRQELLDHIWGDRFQYDTGTIDVHLNALRRKLGWSKTHPIETIRGVGLVFKIKTDTPLYTIDLQTLLIAWLRRHELELTSIGLVSQLNLTPFVNEMTIEPDALLRMLDSILAALLPNAKPGILKISTRLTVHHFSLTIDLNGTINEFRIPIYSDFEAS